MMKGLRPPDRNQNRNNLLKWIVLPAVFLGLILFAAIVAKPAFTRNKEGTFPDAAVESSPQDHPRIDQAQEIYSAEAKELNTGQELVRESALPTPFPWDGTRRVNLLILGVDYSESDSPDRAGPPRADTMILLSVDPVNKTAGMISIPRDLWVEIPGMVRPNKINAAHRFGELYQLPGGGPGLAMRTVEALLGIPVDYYVRLDFQAFVRLIDVLGGVKIDVPEEITIDLQGEGPNTRKRLEPGRQVLPGEWALAYARARGSEGGDYDRSQRQQQVILGVRDRVLDLNLLPQLILKAPDIYREVRSGVQTNLSLEKAVRLAWLAVHIPDEQIVTAAIGPNQVRAEKAEDGQAISVPIPERIAQLVDEVLGPESGAVPERYELALGEDTTIAIMDGSGNDEYGAQIREYLESRGFKVTSVKTQPELAEKTKLVDTTGKPHTVRYLLARLGLTLSELENRFGEEAEADVLLILGSDWSPNRIPPGD
ncbi:MAG: LCP family protein [Chloroflexi bacterium]|jgi:LCP family protein required for cell wall assembly|nr:LCP family protein [Chloroflexota bacterium]